MQAGTGARFDHFSLIGQFGPSLAAIFLIASTEGSEGLRCIVKSTFNWRVGTGWILLALTFEFFLFLAFTLLHWITYNEFPITNGFIPVAGITALIGTFLIGLFRWGLTEKIG